MRKTLGLILIGFLLTGCYASSLTYVGTSAGLVQGKHQSLATTTASMLLKKKLKDSIRTCFKSRTNSFI